MLKFNYRLYRALGLILLVVAIGVLGYKYLSDSYTWVEALYMTVITVTTVGFSEVDKFAIQCYNQNHVNMVDNLIIDEIEYIASKPNSGRSMEHIKEGYRASKVKSHLVFYKLSVDKTVEIVRILHQRMDVESRMK